MQVTSAYGTMLENKIGYIRIASFKENTVEQFQNALNQLLKQGAKGLVFDVREDGGGLVAALEKIVDP
ncbi:MAG TPA: carboxyl-terminal protease, partial [Ruminococcus sp.]|nr:carboxyl-terminal protease [Ruminococcus sp.]